MNILVIFYTLKNDRNTINEHLYSFGKYSNESCFYVNAACRIPDYITKINFDLIVYHYTFISMKWNGTKSFGEFLQKNKILKYVKGYKVAIPQDEYVYSRNVCRFFREFGIKTVYTCLEKSEWEKVYPKKLSKLEHYYTVLTGYVDEAAVKKLSSMNLPHKNRTWDIGYRARRVPYWLGSHGLTKWKITDVFNKLLEKSILRKSLSNEEKDVLLGDKWYLFLQQCRTVLGCESGASMHDPDGSIWKSTDRYLIKHPKAEFDEVMLNCFPGKDNNLKLFCISPRHFEACITKTCQVLTEGHYSGILKKGRHYISIKKDFSNIKEVIRKIKNVAYCQKIADNAYNDIILSNKYTYKRFVNMVIQNYRKDSRVSESQNSSESLVFSYLLTFHVKYIALKQFFQNHFPRSLADIKLNLGVRRSYDKIKRYMTGWV